MHLYRVLVVTRTVSCAYLAATQSGIWITYTWIKNSKNSQIYHRNKVYFKNIIFLSVNFIKYTHQLRRTEQHNLNLNPIIYGMIFVTYNEKSSAFDVEPVIFFNRDII